MIDTIVFDLGGVLIDLDMEVCKEHFISLLGYTKISELLDPCHQRGIYSDLEEGILSPDAFRAEVLKDSRPGCTPADVDRCMYSFLTGMDPDKAELLNELGSRYRLCLLTNNNDISMGRSHDVLESCGVDWKHLFYREFVSSHMKLLKPDPRIYNSMLAQLGTEASRILFVDDSVENVEVARSLGINALHYQVGTSLRKLVEGVLEG